MLKSMDNGKIIVNSSFLPLIFVGFTGFVYTLIMSEFATFSQ